MDTQSALKLQQLRRRKAPASDVVRESEADRESEEDDNATGPVWEEEADRESEKDDDATGPVSEEEEMYLFDARFDNNHSCSVGAEELLAQFEDCGPSDLERGNLKNLREETHHQNLRNEGATNNNNTINIGTSPSTNPSQGPSTNEPTNTSPHEPTNTSPQESIPREGTEPSNGTTLPTNPSKVSSTNEPNTITQQMAESILGIKFTVLIVLAFTGFIGLLSVPYKINGFNLLLIVLMVVFFLAAIGLVLEKAYPKFTEVIKIISFVFLVLGATILVWALIPKNISWIPWIFFACTAAAVAIGVIERFTDKSSV